MAGTLDAGHGAQDQLRHGHEGAGVAGRDGDVGLALVHGVDGEPQAGALAAAQRLAGLVGHGDGERRVDDARLGRQRGKLVQLRPDARLIAVEDEAQRRMALQRERGARNDNVGPVIASHGVERYGPRLRHVAARLANIPQNGGRIVDRLPTRKRADHTLLQLRNNWILAALAAASCDRGRGASQPRSLSFFKAANGPLSPASGLPSSSAANLCARFARVGIEGGRQRLVDDPADIDAAVLDRLDLGRAQRLDFFLAALRQLRRRPELDIESTLGPLSEGIEGDDTALRQSGRHLAGKAIAGLCPSREW